MISDNSIRPILTHLRERESSASRFMLDDVVESVGSMIGDEDLMDLVPVGGIVEVQSCRRDLKVAKER